MDKKYKVTVEQKAEYDECGALIVREILSKDEITKGLNAYDAVMKMQARESGISEADYYAVISQIRDLWKFHDFFNQLIFKSSIPAIAAQLMGKNAARLLHDHVISKPMGKSLEVPWHQDYPYWPTDRPGGLSVWLALDDVDDNAGPLEIIPSSQLLGEERPVDFIKNPNRALDQHPERLKLPVKKGDAVILHSLTWHRTGPNISSPNRRAYISLWIPPESRYAPLHSDWHPVNFNVKVRAGELLNEDWFPVIGTREEGKWNAAKFSKLRYHGPKVEDDDLSMFNASRVTKRKLAQWLNLPMENDLYLALLDPEYRFEVCSNLKTQDILIGDQKQGEECLKLLSINAVAFSKFKARNVCNEAYIQFNQLFQP